MVEVVVREASDDQAPDEVGSELVADISASEPASS